MMGKREHVCGLVFASKSFIEHANGFIGGEKYGDIKIIIFELVKHFFYKKRQMRLVDNMFFEARGNNNHFFPKNLIFLDS